MAKLIDKGRDVLDSLTHDQTDRTGATCGRIARSLDRGVDPEALAKQLTATQRKNNSIDPEIVTEQDVLSAAKMHRINRSRQAYPKAIASDLELAASDDYYPEGNYTK